MIVFLTVVGGCITGIVGIGGIVAVIWAVGRVRGLDTTLGLLVEANKGLEGAYEQLKERQADERRECAEALADLRGQLAALTGDFGREIAKTIVEAVKEET